jgi:hypothetical protein
MQVKSIKDDVNLMGAIDSNYYCRPLDENMINDITYVNSSGVGVGNAYELKGWQDAFVYDKNSQRTARQLSSYTINSLLSTNKFANGSFATNISGLSTFPSGIGTWISAKLNGGTFQATMSATAGQSEVKIPVGAVSAAKTYVLRFSVQSTKDTLLNVLLYGGSGTRLTETKVFKVGPTTRQYEFVFPAPLADANARVSFITKAVNCKLWLDDVEFYEADVTVLNPDSRIRFEYNASTTAKTIPLDAAYVDVKNKPYSGSLILQPFTSIVLLKEINTETLQQTVYNTTSTTCTATGSILREYWSNVSGTSVSAIPLSTTPSSSTKITSFETPSNSADNYGQRIRGYICAPMSGTYTFYIASDDNSQLWLSTSDNPSAKVMIASVTGWTAAREWTKFPSQKSVNISLKAGTKYYIELLHKEGGGGDNLAVGWMLPGSSSIVVIPGSVLSPFVAVTTTSAVNSALKTQSFPEAATIQSLQPKVYPNPSTSYFNLAVPGNGDQPINLSIIDMNGRVIEQKTGFSPNSIFQVGHQLPRGIYLLQVVQGTQKTESKLIKM